jgi:glucokinase-like ROK family protein
MDPRPPLNDSTLTLDPLEGVIVQAIRTQGPQSRSELARRLEYSRASLTSIVGRMQTVGILREVGEGQSAGGRRPQLLDLNPELGYVAGVDIGATSVDIALSDFNGRILERLDRDADVRMGPEPFLNLVCDLIAEMLSRQGLRPEALIAAGVGVPGPVEFVPGLLVAPPLMPTWERYAIRDHIRGRFPNARVVVDNDVNIMAKGEQEAGGGGGLENFLFVKVGTGIGCGIICHGEVYRGSDGCAGDIGHICVDYNGPICHCGNAGCLEAMAAGPAIAEMARQRALAGESPFLARRLEERGTLTAVDVGDAAASGDRVALEIIRRSGQMIGGVLASLVNFFNPSAIFIGGGVAGIGNIFLSTIRQATLRRATALSTRQLRVEYSQLGADAGVIGAIRLALEHVFIVK